MSVFCFRGTLKFISDNNVEARAARRQMDNAIIQNQFCFVPFLVSFFFQGMLMSDRRQN